MRERIAPFTRIQVMAIDDFVTPDNWPALLTPGERPGSP
jgi:hypothetical protein